jgi:hypothetical protein
MRAISCERTLAQPTSALWVSPWARGARSPRRNLIESDHSSSCPEKPDDLPTAAWTAKCIGWPVEDVEERHHAIVSPDPDDLTRGAGCVSSEKMVAYEEPDVLVTAVTASAVPRQGIEPRVAHPKCGVIRRASLRTPVRDKRLSQLEVAIDSPLRICDRHRHPEHDD